jgi:hypothetical protein
MKWRIQIYECCNSGRNIHVDQIPRRVCSIWSLTFSTPLADFQPCRQMSATALQALQAPGTEGIHTQSKNMWIFHNFPAVVSEAVRTCPRLLHNHIHQNHRKSVWLVGLPMGLNVGKGHNQPIYQKSNAWIIFLAIYLFAMWLPRFPSAPLQFQQVQRTRRLMVPGPQLDLLGHQHVRQCVSGSVLKETHTNKHSHKLKNELKHLQVQLCTALYQAVWWCSTRLSIIVHKGWCFNTTWKRHYTPNHVLFMPGNHKQTKWISFQDETCIVLA